MRYFAFSLLFVLPASPGLAADPGDGATLKGMLALASTWSAGATPGREFDARTCRQIAFLAGGVTDPTLRDRAQKLADDLERVSVLHARVRFVLGEVKRLKGKAVTAPGGPAWLRELVGSEAMAVFTRLTEIELNEHTDGHAEKKPRPKGEAVSDDWLKNLANLPDLNRLELAGTSISDAGLASLSNLKSLERLNICLTPLTDGCLKHLAGLTNLRRLVIASTKVTGSGFKDVADWPKIESINLHSCPTSDEGLAAISRFRNLQRLEIVHSKVTDAGLKHLGKLSNLRQLHVASHGATRQGLGFLENLTKLYQLDLYEELASNEGLAHAGKLTGLKILNLYVGPADDAGLASLRTLTGLEELTIGGLGKVTDAAVAHLAGLKSLKQLTVNGTKITESGMQRLRTALPATRVEPPAPGKQRPASLKYLWAKAYHLPPETTTEESGYFSLCEGKDGKIYIGTAAYGRNSFLVEFDPLTEKMRVVLDTHKVVGLPLEATGYAAQAKLHTRNFVGPSGKIYVGSKQGYPSAKEKASGKIPTYRGGYVLTYDPATGKAVNLGMPLSLDDKRQPPGAKEGEGVIDVVADEARGLIYAITCEHQHWMLLDTKKPEKGFRDLGPILRNQPNTLIDKQGRATAITKDYKVARFDPTTDKVSVDELLVDGKPFRDVVGPKAVHPDWRLAADGRTAYLQLLNDLRLFQIDLSAEAGKPVSARSLGERIKGKNPDSRGSISIAADGRVYSAVRVDNETGFGMGYLHHVVRFDSRAGGMADLGVIAVKNPDFFDFKGPQAKNPDGSLRPRHGYHTLPDGTLTPLYVIMSLIVARDGTIYATTIYPYTLLRIPAVR